MANPDHLEILKQGVEQWNKWRKEHREVLPDLSGADLREANLSKANFDSANLREADLSGANLNGVNLRNAHLYKAQLSGANLHGAILPEAMLFQALLIGADLSGANLTGACLQTADLSGAKLSGAKLSRADLNRGNLRGTNLTRTNLRGASLSQADLSEAQLGGADFTKARAWDTNFTDVDLSTVKGLETVLHEGRSTVDGRTISKSHGKIPEVFLRGCGLQDWEIELIKLYQSDLAAADLTTTPYRVSDLRSGGPFRYSSCFISYSTKDQEFADRLYADLQNKGVRCWFAPMTFMAGASCASSSTRPSACMTSCCSSSPSTA